MLVFPYTHQLKSRNRYYSFSNRDKAGTIHRDGTESVHRQEEGSRGKYKAEVEGVPEVAARGNSRDRMLVFSCTPRLESMYRHYPIFKSDEAIAIAIYIAILVTKDTVKKEGIF